MHRRREELLRSAISRIDFQARIQLGTLPSGCDDGLSEQILG